jgi:hypothetical protein
MSREINFRCFDTERETMIENCSHIQRDGLEVMQYTGLNDKNGTEIYEGDLVRYAKHEVLIVEYRAPAFTLRNPNANDYWQWASGLEGLGQGGAVDVEVIGNIWDTPELLEAES